MPYLLVIHKVQDYKNWKPVFDEHSTVRSKSGSKGGQIFRNSADNNEVVALFQYDTNESMHQFANSDDLRKTMEKAGVVGQPQVYFLEEIEKVKN